MTDELLSVDARTLMSDGMRVQNCKSIVALEATICTHLGRQLVCLRLVKEKVGHLGGFMILPG